MKLRMPGAGLAKALVGMMPPGKTQSAVVAQPGVEYGSLF